MDLKTELSILDQIYSMYDKYTGCLDLFCKKRCAHCCTQNVTLTTLEGYNIARFLTSEKNKDLYSKLHEKHSQQRFKPKITTNQLAELCIQEKDIPDEEMDPRCGKCPFLTHDLCLIYPVRPFGCRCLVSKTDCKEKGCAYIDPFTMTINNIFLQYIEHVDAKGGTANLIDILLFFETEENQRQYEKRIFKPEGGLIANRKIPALIIPPEHHAKIKPILEQLQQIKA